jgi:hypothetical protein
MMRSARCAYSSLEPRKLRASSKSKLSLRKRRSLRYKRKKRRK